MEVTMEEATLLEIINRIKMLLESGHWIEAREYTDLEINNLTSTTAEQCKNTKYHFYPTYCKYCSNVNCKDNQNK